MADDKDTKRTRTLDELMARIPELQAKAKQRAAGETGGAPRPPTPKVQLPLWPEPVRAVPNGFLRSALFGAIAKGRRRYMDGEQIAAVDGIEIRYTGQRLDQGDLDVWQSVLHAVRLQSLGSKCRVTSYQLLKALGKTDTGKNRATLSKRITRLVASALTVKQGRYSYIGSLIAGAARDEQTQEWVIELDPRLRPLFAGDQFTYIEWAVRRSLDGHQLAQWLHGFFSSHAQPYPIKIETLHRLCGSEAGEMWKFAQTLRKALDDVAKACAAHGEAFKHEIRGDTVYPERRGSGAQRRHLAKMATRPRKPHG
jgi:hypothetical protein